MNYATSDDFWNTLLRFGVHTLRRRQMKWANRIVNCHNDEKVSHDVKNSAYLT